MVARSRTAAAFAVAGMGSGRVAAPHSPAAAVVAGMVGRVVVGARASSELASVEPIAALLAALAVVAVVVAFAVRVSFFLQLRLVNCGVHRIKASHTSRTLSVSLHDEFVG